MTNPAPRPDGDPRRAHRALICTTTTLYLGVGSLVSAALAAVAKGDRSPLAGLGTYLVLAALAMFVIGSLCWIQAYRMRRDPAVRLACVQADLADLDMAHATATAELAAARVDLPGPVMLRDGTTGWSPRHPTSRVPAGRP